MLGHINIKNILVFVALIMADSTWASHNLCAVLKRPNSLLLARFLKIKIQRTCQEQKQTITVPSTPRTGRACWFLVPPLWAKSIKYPKLQYTGIMLRTRNPNAECPDLNYEAFENLTFNTHIKLENNIWKTKQTNRLGRFLRARQRLAPPNSPHKISAGGVYQVHYLEFGNIIVPLAKKIRRSSREALGKI